MKHLHIFSFLISFYGLICIPVQANEAIWILVDTVSLQLEVKRADKTLLTLDNISLGRNGAGFKQRKGDDTTPLGTYKIGWINNKSRFHTFFGFTYPSIKNASTALLDNLITEKTYNRIIRAHKNNQAPPQNTPLGGQIGIHGLGRADMAVHSAMNWTHGCIALTNKQVNQLARWVKKGTVVKVK